MRHGILTYCTLALLAVPAAALDVRSYTATELGFMASSHLILGKDDAILVDAQFSRSETLEVVRLVRESGRHLRTIFITSSLPEHYLGLPFLTAAFPQARVLARPAVASAIAAHAQEEIDHWEPIYLDDVAKSVVVPEALEAISLELDGVTLEIHEVAEEDDDGILPSAVNIPSEKTLLASDFAFGNVHPFLAGIPPEVWLRGLSRLRERVGEVGWVFPGHGQGGGTTVLEEDERYLMTFAEALRRRADNDGAARLVLDAFPDYDMPILLERSLRSLRRPEG